VPVEAVIGSIATVLDWGAGVQPCRRMRSEGRLSVGDEPTHRASYDETGIGTTSALAVFAGGPARMGRRDERQRVEWTRSIYKDIPTTQRMGEKTGGKTSVARVLRGGAFGDDQYDVRCASRGGAVRS